MSYAKLYHCPASKDVLHWGWPPTCHSRSVGFGATPYFNSVKWDSKKKIWCSSVDYRMRLVSHSKVAPPKTTSLRQAGSCPSA